MTSRRHSTRKSVTSTGPSFSFPRYKDIVMGVPHETCLVYVSQGSLLLFIVSPLLTPSGKSDLRLVHSFSCSSAFLEFPFCRPLEPRWRRQTYFQRRAVSQAPATEAEAYVPGPGSTSMRRSSEAYATITSTGTETRSGPFIDEIRRYRGAPESYESSSKTNKVYVGSRISREQSRPEISILSEHNSSQRRD